MEFAAEVVNGSLHSSTHLDALVHIQSEGRIFGGEREDEVRTDRGFRRHGAETIPPILTRGLVLDIAGARGVEALEDGHEISVSEVEAALEGAGTAVREGDAVLVRTGKIRDFWTKPRDFHRAAPGVGTEAAIWLFERGMALLGTDTSGTEPAPISDRSRTLHVAMLVERGVHLVENLNLDLVCGKGLSEGLFVCLPLRFTGATGSWVRPVLVV
jgi:kynurenine formamidase